MNIVKFKDVILTSETAPLLTEKQIEFFNEYLKGKYSYALNWKYAVPFEDATETEIAQLSEELTLPAEVTVASLDLSILPSEVIDIETTDHINSVSKYKSYNNFIPDSDITIDELKLFRRWLASTLLDMDADTKEYDEKTSQMLNYYKKDMYDEVIKQLTNFRVIDNKVIFTTTSTCNCTPVVGAQLSTTSTCDPILIYRKSIYDFMVQTFSKIDFWTVLDVEFLTQFKAYIDGIIGYNLPLYTSEYVSEFADCSCINTIDPAQQALMRILKNLSTSLQYMIDRDVDGHKNFIGQTLREWSSKLYEKMQWT